MYPDTFIDELSEEIDSLTARVAELEAERDRLWSVIDGALESMRAEIMADPLGGDVIQVQIDAIEDRLEEALKGKEKP